MGGTIGSILDIDKKVYGAIANPSRAATQAAGALNPAKPKLPGGISVDTDAAAAAAGERERLANRKRGRASTILTGPLGDLNPAQLGRKVLTGS